MCYRKKLRQGLALTKEEKIKLFDAHDPALRKQLIEALTAAGIPFVQAVFEADPQLVHFNNTGNVHVIATCDDDIITVHTRTHKRNQLFNSTIDCCTNYYDHSLCSLEVK
jgi:5'-3' exonuclease